MFITHVWKQELIGKRISQKMRSNENVFQYIDSICLAVSVLGFVDTESQLIEILANGMDLTFVFNNFRNRLPNSILEMKHP